MDKPRFDSTINLGHLLTVATFLAVALAGFANLREEQLIHQGQLKAIQVWIDKHDTTFAVNMAQFQELRTHGAVTTQILQGLVTRVERVEARR